MQSKTLMQSNIKDFLQNVLIDEKYLNLYRQYDHEYEKYDTYDWSSQVRANFSQSVLTHVFIASNVVEASKDTRLRKRIEIADLSLSTLTAELEKESPKLWEAASLELDRIDETLRGYAAANASFERKPLIRLLSTVQDLTFKLSFSILPSPIGILGIPGLLVGAYLLAALLSGWTAPINWVLSLLRLPWDISSSLAAIGITAAVATALASGLVLSIFAFDAIDTWLRGVIGLRRSRSIPDAEGSIEDATRRAEQAIIQEGLLPEIDLLLREYSDPSYSTELTIEAAPTLAEVFNPEYEITTEAKTNLDRLIKHMPGGSIGIAGPRGIGKTTLLRALFNTKELKSRPVLSIMTSAPVEYQARDFVLHIFSSICKRFLDLTEATEETQDPWRSMRRLQDPTRQGPVASLFFDLLGGKRALGFLLVGALLIWSSLHLVDVVSATNAGGSTPEKVGLLERYVKGLGIQPGFVFYWGVLFTMLGAVGTFAIWPLRIMRQRRTRYREQSLEMQYDQYRRTGRYRRRGDVQDREEYLVAKCRELLDEIRFQQSFTSGWGGTYKGAMAPVSVEERNDSSVSLTKTPLTLPEIIARYHSFIEDMGSDYTIVIVIDELDKLGSDELAQRFLNEIKALFGLENCFYLISVSESALTSFEQRGLPIRDAFDSSFDDIIRMDYLDLQKSQRLLRRRVIGVPVPFLDFCHCMAGGLPRDFIRTFRALFEELSRATSGEASLARLSDSLLKADLRAKLHAASMAATDKMQEMNVDHLVETIRRTESLLKSRSDVLSEFSGLLDSYRDLLRHGRSGIEANPALTQDNPDEVTRKSEKLASVSTELGVYLYYVLTLSEFFGRKDLNQDLLKEAENSGWLDRLVTARHLISVSPSMAESEIATFRKAYTRDHTQDTSVPNGHHKVGSSQRESTRPERGGMVENPAGRLFEAVRRNAIVDWLRDYL
jgi:GTPase SAR1 family protein